MKTCDLLKDIDSDSLSGDILSEMGIEDSVGNHPCNLYLVSRIHEGERGGDNQDGGEGSQGGAEGSQGRSSPSVERRKGDRRRSHRE